MPPGYSPSCLVMPPALRRDTAAAAAAESAS
eukprot:CAMPEP_0177382212 /NCGR_PEP_ID=MMETSP0368-20130122/48486_1 /TAXON_ID=447022 ORGANISM="Scrippsiella hangoei-like, Strain SHHI-4" /NCGR_SAMPLE_ID=MMETSP0368 /ASSEMBLY_ACC=CAM_ASM_000363 /LENGTH=30 /DNA_ID= /DNA_START= /DNA_END= /DNA_ORIENTATION=